MASQSHRAKHKMSATLLSGSPVCRKHCRKSDIIRTGHQTALPFPCLIPSNPDYHIEGSHMTRPVVQPKFNDLPVLSSPSSGRAIPAPGRVVQQVLKLEEETKQLINAYGEQLKYIMEESSSIHRMSLLGAIQNTLLKKMKEKDDEIERAELRNVQLVEQVKQLMFEWQLWQSMAQSNEVMVSNLRSNLEKVVAQNREHGCREGPANDDAESCNAGTCSEKKNCRNCRACGNIEVSVLLLPCRHLCLCRDCDVRQASCPICGALKNASVHVHME